MFKLYPPTLIYSVFSLVQIFFDFLNNYNIFALYKTCGLIIISVLLNILCENNLSIVAWIIVFVPFILMTELIILAWPITFKQFEQKSIATVQFYPVPPGGDSSPAYES